MKNETIAPPEPKAFLFDRDGTLLDLQKTWATPLWKALLALAQDDISAAERLARHAGLEPQTMHLDMNSPVLVQAPETYLSAWAGILETPLDSTFRARFSQAVNTHACENVTLLPGAYDIVWQLHHAGFPLGILTNGTEKSARAQLEAVGILDAFSFVAGFDSGFAAKPDPAGMHGFADHVGQPVAQIALVGDSHVDVETAQSAGAIMLGVSTGVMSLPDLQGLCTRAAADLTTLLTPFTSPNG